MYQVLYRKYRPQVFADVVGQPQVTKVLAEQVSSGRLSHAYLFTGSRGTGKTTCARIFAKAVCCEHPKGGDPCCECEICRGIDSGSILDYSEMDAASNRSIEDIRRIREEAWIAPARAKRRIYVLDEVHMLTNEAFNALLKILEEPPEHVIFILATTDVQKLPGTILSRCQRFDFMRIEPQLISARLVQVAAAENRVLTESAAAMIAGMADGAMRDSLSILDRCMSEPGEIDEAAVAAAVGLVGKDALFRLADAVCRGDSSEAIRMVNEFHRSSCDSERLCSDLLTHFRNYMIVRSVRQPETIVVCTRADMEKYRQRAAAAPLEKILFFIDVLSETAEKLKRSTNGVVDAETAILRLCRPELSETENALVTRIRMLEKRIAELEARPAAQPAAPVPAAQPPRTEAETIPEPAQPTASPAAPALAQAPPPPTAKNDPPTKAEAAEKPSAPVAEDFPAMPSDDAEDDPPMTMPFGDADDDPPMPPPFGDADDDPPMPPPFGDADDDPPMTMPFGDADDDPPMPPPFGDMDDDPPMPPPFGDADDDPPMAMPFGDADDDPPMPMPFGDADSAPPSAPAVPAGDPGPRPFEQWPAVCDEILRISPMFCGFTPGSAATENGNSLILSSPMPTFKAIMTGSTALVEAIRRAVKNVTGRDYDIKFA